MRCRIEAERLGSGIGDSEYSNKEEAFHFAVRLCMRWAICYDFAVTSIKHHLLTNYPQIDFPSN